MSSITMGLGKVGSRYAPRMRMTLAAISGLRPQLREFFTPHDRRKDLGTLTGTVPRIFPVDKRRTLHPAPKADQTGEMPFTFKKTE